MEQKKPASCRLRKGRFSESNRIYLITCATYKRRPLFTKWRCGQILAHSIINNHHAETLCYVVMPDHYHWLMQLTGERSLSQVMQGINSFTAHRINRQLHGTGRVWQGGFHDYAVRREADLKTLARYVVANPIRANLVEKLGDYPFWDAMWL